MSDNDLIRRGDAIAALTNLMIFSEFNSDEVNAQAVVMINKAHQAIRALPAADPALDRIIANTRAKALRDAASTQAYDSDGTISGAWDHKVFVRISAILALIDKEPTK